MSFGDQAYTGRHRETLHAAERILSIVIARHPGVRSAVDVGCGVGTWLSVLAARGVGTIRGLDGPWVGERRLVIPPAAFRRVDLEQLGPEAAGGRCDLALSLEVAEHLPEARAEGFVALLAALSDVVLFAAAIPGQGGVGHRNEQWPAYWARLFARHGYAAADCIRPAVWDDAGIPFWYRQNALLYERAGGAAGREGAEREGGGEPMALVHPALWELRRRGLARRLADKLRRRGPRSAGTEGA